jgi:hypothetical protein
VYQAERPFGARPFEGEIRSDRILVPVQFPWQFFCGERGPDVYYRLVSQLEYTAEQLATEEARASQEGGR